VFAIWSKHDVHPAKMLAPLLFQAPVFISFYFAISRMAEGLPSMRDGGFAWFQDLSIADPTFALPIISSLTFLAAVEFAPQNPAVKSSQREMTKWGLRALGVAMVPLTASFPSGVFVYWITSNVFSFAQTVLLRVPFAKRAMGIPEDPPPSKVSMSVTSAGTKIEKMFGVKPEMHKGNPKVRAVRPVYASASEVPPVALNFFFIRPDPSGSFRRRSLARASAAAAAAAPRVQDESKEKNETL
jgi:YidC/Oxa1 family membrane protein insertase